MSELVKQVFFVHVPKTAGMSVRNMLSHNELFFPKLKDREHKFGVRNAYRFGSSSFKTNYFDSYQDDPGFKDSKIKFTVLRNPFDQLVSYYLHDAHGTGNESGWANINNNFGFKTFKEFILQYCSGEHKKWHVPLLSVSLYSQLFGEDKKCLVNYGVRFKKFEKGIKNISKLSGNKMNRTYPRNVTGVRCKKDYKEFYTPELIDIVSNKMEWELDAFNYSYDGPRDKESLIELNGLKINNFTELLGEN